MWWISLLLFCFINCTCLAQPKTDGFLQDILSVNHDTALTKVLGYPKTYRLQIIYTQINRDKHNQPSFQNYYLNVDPDHYFNPASTVKLPLALLALEKLNTMHRKGVNKFTPMQFDSSYAGQTTEYRDSTSENQLPSIAHFIKKAFLVSDNDAYNRLYEFTGQQTINRSLHDKGYRDIRITRQFKGFTPDQNRHTNPVRFIKEAGSLVWLQPPAYNTDSFHFPHEIKLGKAHFDRNDSLVNEPIDFTMANNMSLEDLQQLLQSVLFPSSVPAQQRFGLAPGDFDFLYRYLSQFPSETNYPYYDTAKFYNSYVKFFFKNGSRELPGGLRVFNKVGWAYGFLTDVSYIADFKNKVEFMLSATVYVNSDGVLNDDRYDYDSIGYPFLYQLGQTIYQYERRRPRNNKPNLSRFAIHYEHRDPLDKRTPVKEVDN
jgi:Beta-lactamase enzyme family